MTFSNFGNRKYFRLYHKNQESYEQTKTTIRFSMSERSKNILPSNPNNSVKGRYNAKAECGRNFQISEIGNVFVYNIGIKRVMNRRRPRLDSARLKDPEISFDRILIIMSRGIIGEKEECERNFQISEIGNVFAYNIGIKRVMNKRRPRLDSECPNSPKI